MNPRLPAQLYDLFLFAMMLVMAEILTFAMVLQYRGGEIPCPLCLLQRVAMFGVCFGESSCISAMAPHCAMTP